MPYPCLPTLSYIHGRDAFSTMSKNFSFLRKQFSSMSILDELHKQAQDKFVYTCNNCKSYVETVCHCIVCDDFNLCVNCKEKYGHPHPLIQEVKELSLRRYIDALVHACQCREPNCPLPCCQKMTRMMVHMEHCQKKTKGRCPVCMQLTGLCCYHAKHCNETKCLVPSCSTIKCEIQQLQRQQRLQQAESLLKDSNLCVSSKEKDGHSHPMEKREAKDLSLRRYIDALAHAYHCREPNCPLPRCQKLKRMIVHMKHCQKKTKDRCPICKQLGALRAYHAKHCNETECLIPFCSTIKCRIQQQQWQKRLQQTE